MQNASNTSLILKIQSQKKSKTLFVSPCAVFRSRKEGKEEGRKEGRKDRGKKEGGRKEIRKEGGREVERTEEIMREREEGKEE